MCSIREPSGDKHDYHVDGTTYRYVDGTSYGTSEGHWNVESGHYTFDEPAMLIANDAERQSFAPAVKAFFASAKYHVSPCEHSLNEEHHAQCDGGHDAETTIPDQGAAYCSLRHDMKDASASNCNCTTTTEAASGVTVPNGKHTFTKAERSCFRRSEIQNHEHRFDNNLRCFVSYHPDVSKIEYEKKQEQPQVEQTKQKPKQVATQGHSKDSSCTPTSPQMRAYAGSTPQQLGDVRILSVEEPTDATTRQVI